MITIQQLFNAAKFSFSGGGDYLWNSFGPNAHIVEFCNEEFGENFSISAIIDRKDQTVYSIECWADTLVFRWINPNYLDAFKEECAFRDIEFEIAFDDVKYDDKDEQDILEIMERVIDGKDVSHYYGTVCIELDLSKDEIYDLAMKAHEQNITLNEFISNIVEVAVEQAKEVIKDYEKESDVVETFMSKGQLIIVHETKDSFGQLLTFKNTNGKKFFTIAVDNLSSATPTIDVIYCVTNTQIGTMRKAEDGFMTFTNSNINSINKPFVKSTIQSSDTSAMIEIIQIIMNTYNLPE